MGLLLIISTPSLFLVILVLPTHSIVHHHNFCPVPRTLSSCQPLIPLSCQDPPNSFSNQHPQSKKVVSLSTTFNICTQAYQNYQSCIHPSTTTIPPTRPFLPPQKPKLWQPYLQQSPSCLGDTQFPCLCDKCGVLGHRRKSCPLPQKQTTSPLHHDSSRPQLVSAPAIPLTTWLPSEAVPEEQSADPKVSI